MLTPNELETLSDSIENSSYHTSLGCVLEDVDKDDLVESLRLMARITRAFIAIAKKEQQ